MEAILSTTGATDRLEYMSIVYYLNDYDWPVVRELASHLLSWFERHAFECRLWIPLERGPLTSDLLQECANTPSSVFSFAAENRESRAAGALDFVGRFFAEARPTVRGTTCEPTVAMSIGLPFLTRRALNELAALTCGMAQIVSRHRCGLHGLMDIGMELELGRGLFYEARELALVSFRRRLEQLTWLRLGQLRRSTLRGVFWGQYLGPPLASRLGDVRLLARDYMSLDAGVTNELIQVQQDGALLIRLTDLPEYICLGALAPWTLSRATFLSQRFREAGIM